MCRRNLIESKSLNNSTNFLLNPRNRVIQINEKVFSDFSKYKLTDALQRIVESESYFPGSIFSVNPEEQIRRIIQEFSLEREQLLELSDSTYQRRLKQPLK